MTQDIKTWIKLMEAEAPHSGASQSANVQYSIDGDKVIARLRDVDSARYTRLGRNLKRMEWLAKRMEYLKEQTKQESRELVADLFHAEDANKTRVVETMGFIFKLTKDPKAAQTVKYAKVLEELQDKLTPELVRVLETLVEKHTTIQKAKPASLSATDKRDTQYEESINEGWGDKVKAFFKTLVEKLDAWGRGYDRRLSALEDSLPIL